MKKIAFIFLFIVATDIHAAGPPPIFDSGLTNFWSTNGSLVTFQASGWSLPNTTNDLFVKLDTNILFDSSNTVAHGGSWNLRGLLEFDGTNMDTAIQYTCDDPTNRHIAQFTTISNADISPTFLILQSGTNLTLTAGSIQAGIVVPPLTTAASLDFLPSIITGLAQLNYVNIVGEGTTNFALTIGANATNYANTVSNVLAGNIVAATTMQQGSIDAATGLPTVNYGAPASGTYAVGALWLDVALAQWRCTAAGSPGTWIQVAPAVVAVAPVVVIDNYLIEIPSQNWARFYWSVAAAAWKPVNLQP